MKINDSQIKTISNKRLLEFINHCIADLKLEFPEKESEIEHLRSKEILADAILRFSLDTDDKLKKFLSVMVITDLKFELNDLYSTYCHNLETNYWETDDILNDIIYLFR